MGSPRVITYLTERGHNSLPMCVMQSVNPPNWLWRLVVCMLTWKKVPLSVQGAHFLVRFCRKSPKDQAQAVAFLQGGGGCYVLQEPEFLCKAANLPPHLQSLDSKVCPIREADHVTQEKRLLKNIAFCFPVGMPLGQSNQHPVLHRDPPVASGKLTMWKGILLPWNWYSKCFWT